MQIYHLTLSQKSWLAWLVSLLRVSQDWNQDVGQLGSLEESGKNPLPNLFRVLVESTSL